MHLSFLLVLVSATLSGVAGRLVEWPLALKPGWPHSEVEFNSERGEGGLPIVDPPKRIAGYYDLNATADGKLFYFYFESRDADPTAPLVFWTNGGPGCSSLFGLFMENGPLKIEEDLTLSWTEFGWDIGHNVLFVEQPIGTGFSFSEDERDTVYGEEQVAADMYNFFQEFLDAHPELREKDLFLTGESYAGHYIPAIGARIVERNQESGSTQINLKGVAIGNGWYNQGLQSIAWGYYARLHHLIATDLWELIIASGPYCTSMSGNCDASRDKLTCLQAKRFCWHNGFYPIMAVNQGLNYYDIRKQCVSALCYNETLLTTFLNLPEVQEVIGVHDRSWEDCSNKVYSDMRWEMATSTDGLLAQLLNSGIRVLIYAGDQDLICNWIGGKNVVDSLKWEEAHLWQASRFNEWRVDGATAGMVRSTDKLTYLTVAGAGHMVPMDQPRLALELLTTFTRNQAWSAGPSVRGTPKLEGLGRFGGEVVV